jgi:DNA-binding response OmpR family regulator
LATRVLVVENDRRLSGIIKRGLLEESYLVDTVYDGEEAMYMAETSPYNLIILDTMIPKKDGIAVCQELRAKKVNTPILMLTARDSIEDRVKGLGSGADDYMVKPFTFSELLARLRALSRREIPVKTPMIQVGNLVLDTSTREAWRGQRKIDLSTKECFILEYFMRHPNMVITRTMIEENAWDYDFDSTSNFIDAHVRRIRSKIDEEGNDSLIQTIRGAGYRLRLV